jgi:hypothetical protein
MRHAPGRHRDRDRRPSTFWPCFQASAFDGERSDRRSRRRPLKVRAAAADGGGGTRPVLVRMCRHSAPWGAPPGSVQGDALLRGRVFTRLRALKRRDVALTSAPPKRRRCLSSDARCHQPVARFWYVTVGVALTAFACAATTIGAADGTADAATATVSVRADVAPMGWRLNTAADHRGTITLNGKAVPDTTENCDGDPSPPLCRGGASYAVFNRQTLALVTSGTVRNATRSDAVEQLLDVAKKYDAAPTFERLASMRCRSWVCQARPRARHSSQTIFRTDINRRGSWRICRDTYV